MVATRRSLWWFFMVVLSNDFLGWGWGGERREG
jgi:hypothetical protein